MKKFVGFPPEGQYWQFPTIINGFVNILTGTEFKVLWYILRHTYGYQKDMDAISIRQIMDGIKTKNGKVVDVGTGIKQRKTVVQAIQKLEQYGFVEVDRKEGRTSLFRPITRQLTTSVEKDTGVKNNPPPPAKKTQGGVSKSTHTIDNSINNLPIHKEFDHFWSEYPRKIGKPKALKAWQKEKPELQEVLKALAVQRQSEQWEEKRFIPHPTTYLNQRRWEDDLSDYKRVGGKHHVYN